MNTLHSNPKAKPQKRMTGGFLCALFAALLFASCASTSKFAKENEGDTGPLFVSANLDLPVMAAAVKYGFEKMSITVESETMPNDRTILIFGVLPSAMQYWGQNFKMTIVKEEAMTNIYCISQARIKENVTANTFVVRTNLHSHVSLYIEAAKEGIDLNTIDLNR